MFVHLASSHGRFAVSARVRHALSLAGGRWSEAPAGLAVLGPLGERPAAPSAGPHRAGSFARRARGSADRELLLRVLSVASGLAVPHVSFRPSRLWDTCPVAVIRERVLEEASRLAMSRFG